MYLRDKGVFTHLFQIKIRALIASLDLKEKHIVGLKKKILVHWNWVCPRGIDLSHYKCGKITDRSKRHFLAPYISMIVADINRFRHNSINDGCLIFVILHYFCDISMYISNMNLSVEWFCSSKYEWVKYLAAAWEKWEETGGYLIDRVRFKCLFFLQRGRRIWMQLIKMRVLASNKFI